LTNATEAVAAAAEPTTHATYESLYEAHARSRGDDGVGDGDYDVIGEIELDVLRAEGLQPTSTLLDFGCGNGRLAVHAVPYLDQGTYIGTDIAPTFLAHAARRIAAAKGTRSCEVKLVHQVGEQFDIPDHSVDLACAFSVFTHMEHEDMYRYLVQFKRIMRPDGRFVISCLPLTLVDAGRTFLSEASMDPITRWQRVRNVTTSVELVNEIARLAGWKVLRWLPGNEGQARSTSGEMRLLGQSVVVLCPFSG
jgi:SAM-dependent methyltransferase